MNTAIIVYTIIINSIYSGIDPQVALAVADVESKFNVNAVGQLNEQGLYQIMPGFSKYTVKQLKDPIINIREGMRMLKYAKDNCKHKEDKTWVICYNLGVSGGAKIKLPKQFIYYKKIMASKKKFKDTTSSVAVK